jgi:hypothetical protein
MQMQDALRDKVSKIRSRFVRLALLGVIAVVGSPAVAQIQCSDLSVSDFHGNNVPGQITGIATNISDHEMKLVHLVFNLYDSNGTVIGNATAGQSNLAAGGRWRFEAPTSRRFSRFELVRSDCSW